MGLNRSPIAGWEGEFPGPCRVVDEVNAVAQFDRSRQIGEAPNVPSVDVFLRYVVPRLLDAFRDASQIDRRIVGSAGSSVPM